MKAKVELFVKKCPICQEHIARPEQVQIGNMPVAKSPGQLVGLHFIGPVMTSVRGSNYIMVTINHFSGWVKAYPLLNNSYEAVSERLWDDYFPRHGACRVLITDQGAEFKGRDC